MKTLKTIIFPLKKDRSINWKNKMEKYTKEQVNKKYVGKYVEIYKDYEGLYEVRKVYKDIHENTTRGEDVGTEFEYRR